jgi:hypothetical protein
MRRRSDIVVISAAELIAAGLVITVTFLVVGMAIMYFG